MSAFLPRGGSATDIFATWCRDVRIAAAFLTRLPVRPQDEPKVRPLAEVMRAFPIVGAGVGLASGLLFAACSWTDMPPFAAALLALAAAIALTGALHEQGLAATAEGFAGGDLREDKLRIMRDGRLGALGVAVLIITIGIKAAAVANFHSPAAALAALVGAGAASRAAIPIFMNAVHPAAAEHRGQDAGRPAAGDAWAAAALGAFFALFVGIETWLVALIVCTGVGALLIRLARHQVGGYTGYVLGMVQGIVEAVFLLVAATNEL